MALGNASKVLRAVPTGMRRRLPNTSKNTVTRSVVNSTSKGYCAINRMGHGIGSATQDELASSMVGSTGP